MTLKDIVKVALNLMVIYVIGGVLLAGVYAKTSPIIFQKNKEEKEQALNRMMPVHLKMAVPAEARDAVVGVLPEGTEPQDVQVEVQGKDATAQTLPGIDVVVDGSLVDKLLKPLKKAGAGDVEEYSENKPTKAAVWEPWHKHAEVYEVKSEGELQGYIVESYGKGYSSYPNMYVSVSPEYVVRKLNVLSHHETPGLGDEIMLDWFKNQYEGKDLDHLEVIKGPTEDKIQAITGATISTRAVTNAVRDAILVLKEKNGEAEAHYTWGGESGLAFGGESHEGGEEAEAEKSEH